MNIAFLILLWHSRNVARKMPPLYNLPADLRIVRMLAHAYAAEGAFAYLQEQEAWASSEEAAREMAMAACLYHEQQQHDGKVGVNDSARFRATFLEVFLPAFSHDLDALRSGLCRRSEV